MKTCPSPETLMAAACGKADAETTAALRSHAESCPACFRVWREGEALADRLRGWADAPSPDLADQVLAATRAYSWAKPLALAASALVLLGAGWVLLNRPGKPVAVAAAPAVLNAADEWMQQAARDPGVQSEPVVESPEDVVGSTSLVQARQWLVESQGPEGGWTQGRTGAAANYDVGLSSLALLALGATGEKSKDTPALSLRRGFDYLVAQQDPASGLFGPDITGSLYNHTLACLALLADEPSARSPEQDTALREGLRLLVSSQKPEGGWSYLRARTAPPNSGLTAWALLVLMEAESRGLVSYPEEIARGLAWLQTTVDREGRAGYRRPGDHPYGSETLTAAVALCLANRPIVDRHPMERILRRVVQDAGLESDTLDFYRTYFQTAALHEAGLDDAPEMQRLRQRLESAQEQGGRNAGSWAAQDPWSRTGGRVYSTSLAVLALQSN